MPMCFVIMPFSDTKTCTEAQWTEVFTRIIKPAVRGSRLGYDCQRSKARQGSIIKEILTQLSDADVVLADLTDRNPNVFYELGVRHAVTNRTVLVTQNREELSFDLRDYGVIDYDRTSLSSISEFNERVKSALRDIQEKPERSDNPVSNFLKERQRVLLQYHQEIAYRKLSGLLSEVSKHMRDCQECKRSVDQRIAKNSGHYWLPRFAPVAMEELLTTNYISLSEPWLKVTWSTVHGFRMLNVLLDQWAYRHDNEEINSNLLPSIKDRVERLERRLRELLRHLADRQKSLIVGGNKEDPLPPIVLADEEHKALLAP